MARVNVYMSAENGNREVSLGGRGASDRIRVWLNTDNATQSDCNVSLEAEVVGNGMRAKDRRKSGDDRKSVFTLRLPERMDDHCQVIITAEGPLAGLARIGAALCAVKGLQDIARGDLEQAIVSIETAAEVIATLEKQRADLSHVILPGGVNLAHALACVEVCRRLADGTNAKRN